MNNTEWNSKWHKITNQQAHQITGSLEHPGVVYPYPTSSLPSKLQRISGLYEAYVSSFLTQSLSPEDIEVGGELLVTRIDGSIGKGYVFLFGVSGSNVYFNGPYKPYEGHHFDTGSAVPIGKLFGQVEIPK